MRRHLAFTLALITASATTTAWAQQPTQEAIAQTRFSKGRDLFIASKYAEALVEFRGAGELFESPNTRLYIGRCERELGHFAAAYVELERAASEASDRAHSDPRFVSTRDVSKAEATALANKLGHVKILAPGGLPPDTQITLNGAAIATAGVGVTAPIDPGAVVVDARAPGYLAVHKTAQVAAGESVEITIHLDASPQTTPTGPTTTTLVTNPTTPNGTGAGANTGAGGEGSGGTTGEGNGEAPMRDTAPHPGRGLRTGGFVVGGIGIASMGVFAAFAALAQTRFDQLKQQCNGPCDASFNSKIDEGQTYQNIANIALATGGAALLVGTIMIVAGVSAGGPAPPSGQPSALRASVVPVWSAQGPAGVMVGVGHDF